MTTAATRPGLEFYLGADVPWLGRAGVPLMVSHRRLRRRVTLPGAVAAWVCDSGGFTELSTHGEWRTTPAEYVAGLRAYGHLLASADSQAGSFGARKRVGRCPHGLVRWEANCPEWARVWRDDVLAGLDHPRQLDLFAGAVA